MWVSDGSTNVVPDGDDDRAGTHATWRLHAGLVRRALEGGLWQGWDLHPAHLVTRHLTRAVVLGEALPAAVGRLRRYLAAIDAAAESGEAAGAAGGVLDEPATARSLASLVLRAIDAGSAPADEVTAALGVGLPRLERVAASGA